MRVPSSLERPCTQLRAPEYKQQDFAVVSEAELPVKAERRDEVAEVGAVEVVEVEAVVMLVLRMLCRTTRMRGGGTAGTCSMTTKLES